MTTVATYSGYYLRYKADAVAANLPNWNRLRIVKIEATGEALVAKHPMTQASAFPKLPKTFPDYDTAFAWVSSVLLGEHPWLFEEAGCASFDLEHQVLLGVRVLGAEPDW